MPELDLYVLLPILVGICLITFFLGWFLQAKITKSKLDSAENLAAKITTDAESKAKEKISDAERRSKVIVQDAEKAAQNMKKEKLLEVKDEFYKRKLKFEEEVKRREKDVVKVETRLADEKENLTKYNQNLNKMKQEIEQIAADYEVKVANLKVKEQKVEKLSSDFEELIRQENEKLMKISGLNEEEAKNILFDKLINDVKLECAAKLQEIREQTKLEANRLSRNIIMQGIQRSAADHSVETTVSVLQITSDELKGRIIGKEGKHQSI